MTAGLQDEETQTHTAACPKADSKTGKEKDAVAQGIRRRVDDKANAVSRMKATWYKSRGDWSRWDRSDG